MEKPIILIVDDVPTNVKVLADALQQDYRIRIATNGLNALKRAQSSPYPNLILLDVMMPEMDGYQVLRNLKRHTVTQKIPVIFVTAKASENDEQVGLDLGALDYIAKPVSISLLKKRVHNYLAMQQYADIIETLLLIDPSTNIPNQHSLHGQLTAVWNQARDNGQSLSLLRIEINHFHNYNDDYGYGAGAECLQRVAQALIMGVASPNSKLVRCDEGKFVAILPNVDSILASKVADGLRERVLKLNLPYLDPITKSPLSIGIGCTSVTPSETGWSCEQLLQQASESLYCHGDKIV